MMNNSSSSVKKERWETVKVMITYGMSGLIIILLVRSMFHRDHGTLDRLNLNKRTLPSIAADHLKSEWSPYESKCRWSNCFDIFNCTELTIYMYPLVTRTINGKPVTPTVTKEWHRLYKAFATSPYITSDPERACIKLAPYDLLRIEHDQLDMEQLGHVLHSLPGWKGGENFVFLNFNRLPNPPTKLPLGKGLIASADLLVNNHRYDFDLSIGYYSSFLDPITAQVNAVKAQAHKAQRKYDLLIVGHQPTHVNYQVERVQKEHYEKYNVLILKPCLNEKAMCDRYENSFTLSDVFAHSKYCLVTVDQSGHFQAVHLAAALGSGCIPIIAADEQLLPYEPKIDWAAIAVRLSARAIDSSLIPTISQIQPDDVRRRRHRGLYVYETFFSTPRAIVDGFTRSLSDRLFPHQTAPYEYWNGPPAGVRSPMILESIADETGFTAVILAYERIDSVSKAPSLKKVLIVWNNQKKPPPPESEWPQVPIPIIIIKTRRNVLSNRFYPYDEIETDCVLSIDDDIVMLTPDEIEFGYQTWREFPDRLVGYPPRLHLFDEKENNFQYNSEWTNDASIILTGASFYHKYYSHVYSHLTPAHIRDWVDEHMNCEDILMNFVISNATAKAPIKVSPRKKFKCLECSNQNSISIDPGHMVERSECINYFTGEYGKMPLKSVQFRADPVLYKDDPKGVEPKYRNLGDL